MAKDYRIFHDPGLLELMIDIYFEQMNQDELPPTVPGLVLCLGLTKVAELSKLLERYEANQSELEAAENDCLVVGDTPLRTSAFPYPAESMDHIVRALTRIEEYQLTHGLRDMIPATLVKFTLGAYHGVKEVNTQQNQNPTNIIQIAFEAPAKAMQLRTEVDQAKRLTTPVVDPRRQNSNLIEINYASDADSNSI
jgi:hypothetical protein